MLESRGVNQTAPWPYNALTVQVKITRLNLSKNTWFMGRIQGEIEPVTTRVLEPEIRGFLRDSLQGMRRPYFDRQNGWDDSAHHSEHQIHPQQKFSG
jgi:hypothetical protein